MFCANCGEKLSEDSNFCRECGHNTKGHNPNEDQNTPNPQKPATKTSKINYLMIAIPIVILLVLTLSFIAMKTVGSTGPDKVASMFFKGIEKKDPDKIKEVVPREAVEEVEAMDVAEWDEMFSEFDQRMVLVFGTEWDKKVKFTTSTESLTEAVVLIEAKDNPEVVKMNLIKEGEDWKMYDMDY